MGRAGERMFRIIILHVCSFRMKRLFFARLCMALLCVMLLGCKKTVSVNTFSILARADLFNTSVTDFNEGEFGKSYISKNEDSRDVNVLFKSLLPANTIELDSSEGNLIYRIDFQSASSPDELFIAQNNDRLIFWLGRYSSSVFTTRNTASVVMAIETYKKNSTENELFGDEAELKKKSAYRSAE